MGLVVLITDPEGNEHRAADRVAFDALMDQLEERFGEDARFQLRAEGPMDESQTSATEAAA